MNTSSVTSPWKPGAGSHQALNSHHPAGAGRTVDAHSVCRGWGGPSGPPGWKQLTVSTTTLNQKRRARFATCPQTRGNPVAATPRSQRRAQSRGRGALSLRDAGVEPRLCVRPAGTRGGGCLRRGPGPEGRRPPGARAGGWQRQGCGEDSAGTAAEPGEAGSSGHVAEGEAAPGRENRTHQGHFHRQGPEPRRHPHRLCWSDARAGDPSSAPRRGRVFTYQAPPRRRQQGKGIWVL